MGGSARHTGAVGGRALGTFRAAVDVLGALGAFRAVIELGALGALSGRTGDSRIGSIENRPFAAVCILRTEMYWGH